MLSRRRSSRIHCGGSALPGSRTSCPSPSIPESAMAARAGSVVLDRTAPERIFAELKRVVIADRALDGLALIDTLGGTDAVLSERSDLRGVEHRHYHPPRRAEHTRAVSQRRSSSTPEPERFLRRACRCGSGAALRVAGQRAHRGQPRRLGTLFHNVASHGPATSRRTSGSHSSAAKRPEVAGQRRAGIAADWNAFASPFDHAGHPVKAGPGVWAVSRGWVRGGYQAATGAPWA